MLWGEKTMNCDFVLKLQEHLAIEVYYFIGNLCNEKVQFMCLQAEKSNRL